MKFLSPLNDRELTIKPNSQVGFYQYVCLPLYEVTSRAISRLKVKEDQINTNLLA
jgi:hypothetical protein